MWVGEEEAPREPGWLGMTPAGTESLPSPFCRLRPLSKSVSISLSHCLPRTATALLPRPQDFCFLQHLIYIQKNDLYLTAIISGQKLKHQPLETRLLVSSLQGPCINPQILQRSRWAHSWPEHLRTFNSSMTKGMDCLKNLFLKSISLKEGFFQHIFSESKH